MITVRTIVDVEPGAELTTNYTDISGALTARRKVLQQQYNFECCCSRCLSDLKANKSNASHAAIARFSAKDADLAWGPCAAGGAVSSVATLASAATSGGGTAVAVAAAEHTLSVKSQVKKMNPKELKAGLKKFGLSAQGPKKDLIARLLGALSGSFEGASPPQKD